MVLYEAVRDNLDTLLAEASEVRWAVHLNRLGISPEHRRRRAEDTSLLVLGSAGTVGSIFSGLAEAV
jgi:alpha-D-ribose 1-methylphosphonate 5-triphosphate synthase subunit PhnG